jgi:hypothetical protein
MAGGHARHWQLDDNIRHIKRRWRGRRVYCQAGYAFRAIEDFTDRYLNIGLSGMNYEMFLANGMRPPPFYLNVHVYSCTLVNNALPYQWRGRYNEDTDLCLQVLSGGWCTVLFNAFLCEKLWTMQMKGGNTQELYQDDGRLKMARSLERQWPGVVTTTRRFQRPQHQVKDSWKHFDTPLKRREDIDWESIPKIDEYGVQLKEVTPVKSERLRGMMQDHQARHPMKVGTPQGGQGEPA